MYSKYINSQFIHHISITEEGTSLFIMENHGRAFAQIYWYNDDKTSIYLSQLSVANEFKRKGIGAKLLRIQESIGKELGALYSYLWTKKSSWMHEWYKRLGYTDFKDYEVDTEYVWMRKELAYGSSAK